MMKAKKQHRIIGQAIDFAEVYTPPIAPVIPFEADDLDIVVLEHEDYDTSDPADYIRVRW
jgi:hypothetical protein